MALSSKQKKFVNEYLIDGNATRAAERAGYKGDDATLASVGWENLRKPEIADAISRRTSESAMPAEEVLKRLADHARGSMGDFVRINEQGQPQFDFEAAQQAGKFHLVKKLKTKTRSYTTAAVTVKPKSEEAAQEVGQTEDSQDEDSDEEVAIEDVQVTEVTVEFELYDAQSALSLIGKHHKLFADKVEHSGTLDLNVVKGYMEVTPDDWDKDTADRNL